MRDLALSKNEENLYSTSNMQMRAFGKLLRDSVELTPRLRMKRHVATVAPSEMTLLKRLAELPKLLIWRHN